MAGTPAQTPFSLQFEYDFHYNSGQVGPSRRLPPFPMCFLPVPRSDDTVTLVSNDGERFVVPKRVARMSELVLTVTEDEGTVDHVPISSGMPWPAVFLLYSVFRAHMAD